MARKMPAIQAKTMNYREMKMFTFIAVALFTTTLLVTACMVKNSTQLQDNRSFHSGNYKNGKFRNQVAMQVSTAESGMLRTTLDFLVGNQNRTPSTPLPVVQSDLAAQPKNNDLRITWLGHSTCLIQIDGQTILTDPIFSDRASPLSFAGPRRFSTDADISIDELPAKIDVVLISHDHYDHLDYKTILALQEKTDKFFVPLGVASHLLRWGLKADQIVELDWWETKSHGSLKLIATPSCHFSGRNLMDRNKTLWASWVVLGAKDKVFFSGDSGYFPGFKEIGHKYGPFDVTMLESGAYNGAWADIHMMPEDTVKAHQDLQGKVLLPIHWAKFNLALHPWEEPIQRLIRRAGELSIDVTTPRLGESFSPYKDYPQTHWWKLAMH